MIRRILPTVAVGVLFTAVGPDRAEAQLTTNAPYIAAPIESSVSAISLAEELTTSRAQLQSKAGPEIFCLVCWHNEQTNKHGFYSLYCEPPVPSFCRACGGESECHIDPQDGPCHVQCPGSSALNATLSQISLAISTLPPSAAARAIAKTLKTNPALSINYERSLIQAVGCKETIVAQLQLPALVLASVEMPAAMRAVALNRELN